MPDQTIFVDETQILSSQDTSTVLVDEVEVIQVISVAEQGPPGPPGVGGVTTHTLIAGESIGGNRAVISLAAGAFYASADEDHSARVVGISTGAATVGNQLGVQSVGKMTDASWSWTPDMDIYLGINGTLVQTIPGTATFAQRLGYAVTSTSIWIELGEPIVS